MEITVWHGTNQSFEQFDPERLGMVTANSSSRRAFFFAGQPEVAWEYAQHAAKMLVPGQAEHEAKVRSLMKAADRAEKTADWTLYESLIAEAEALEAEARYSDPAGSVLLCCTLSIENPYEIHADDLRLLPEIDLIMDRAKRDGHDCLIIREIHDTPTGAGPVDDHYAVLDPRIITIVSRHPSLDDLWSTAPDPF